MENAYTLFRRAKNFIKKNDFLNASLLLERAMGQEPEKGSIREALAICYFNMGFYGSSKAHFNKAIQIDASNDFAHYGMGMCLVKEKSINRALGHFKIAKFMKPGSRIYGDALRRYNRP
jgi:tetratricopeptide (TPR) repeat protein